MKLISYILLFGSLNAFSNDSDSLFVIGNYYYENEDYEKAINSYLSNDSTKHAQALYHNLGNCYYQIGNIPKSILFYERALLLKKDSQTQENLKLAKKRIKEIETIPSLFFIRWWNSIARFLNTNSWIILNSLFVWVSCYLLFLFLKNRKKRTFNLFLTSFVLTLVLAFVSHRSIYLNTKKYAVIIKKTNLLSNITDSKTKQIIFPGNKVEVIEYKGKFLLIMLPNGEVGWISQSDIEEM